MEMTHRHVGSADRDDDQDSQHESDAGHDQERHPLPLRAGEEEPQAEPDHHERERQIHPVLTGEHHGRAGEQPEMLAQPGQLAERDDRAGERDRPDEGADEQLQLVAARQRVVDAETGRVVHHRRSRSAPPPSPRASAWPPPAPASVSSRTRRATSAPIVPPTAMPAMMSSQLCVIEQRSDHRDHHADDAEQLPRRAETGEDKPFSARMNSTDATRYARATWLAVMLGFARLRSRRTNGRGRAACRLVTLRSAGPLTLHLLRRLLLEHLEHALRDQEAAEDVDRRQAHGDPAEDRAEVDVAPRPPPGSRRR